MRVIINFLSYEQTPYDVQQDTRISELKQMIQQHDGIPAANFELYFNLQKLENAMSLRHYNIHDGALLDIQGSLNPILHPRYVNGVHGRRMDNMLSKLGALGAGDAPGWEQKADVSTLLRQMRQLCV
jgi:hypothetical protein